MLGLRATKQPFRRLNTEAKIFSDRANKMKAQIQCEFAKDSVQMFRYPKKATRKWGNHWFCEEHGSREPKQKPLTEIKPRE